MDIGIKNICIKLGKREITLSIEDAKSLKLALEELFETETKVIHEHTHDHTPYYYNPCYPPFTLTTTTGSDVLTITADNTTINEMELRATSGS